MKAILEFNLPEERQEHKTAIKGIDYYCALIDFEQWLRLKNKHGDKTKMDTKEVMDAFYEILDDINIRLDEDS